MRSVLLDTHVALWVMLDSPKLPKNIRKLATAAQVRLIFHQVSTWEIQIKYELGKLPLPMAPGEFISDAVETTGFSYERIDDDAIFMLGKLPQLHRDPFDRLLVAHAAVKGWEFATVDEQIARYPVRVFR